MEIFKNKRGHHDEACSLRLSRAQYHIKVPSVKINPTIGVDYIGLFSKGLPHDQEGTVKAKEIEELLASIASGDSQRLSLVSTEVPLDGISSVYGRDYCGACSDSYTPLSPPLFDDAYLAAMMAELYCMALARDVPFSSYSKSRTIKRCCSYLSSYTRFGAPSRSGKISPDLLFRLSHPGQQGAWLSQFLYRDIPMGGAALPQKYIHPKPESDYLTKWEDALSAQSGVFKEDTIPLSSRPRYILCLRDLSYYCQQTPAHESFHRASLLLRSLGKGFPPPLRQGEGIDWTLLDIDDTMTRAARLAASAAWCIKWRGMYIRPEAYGMEVERCRLIRHNPHRVHQELLSSPLLKEVQDRWGSWLLPQSTPTGSPLSPAYPCEQGAIAGACCTVLKFFFDSNATLTVHQPDRDGELLTETIDVTTVGRELDLLAQNIVCGQMAAGQQWRIGAWGIELGEEVAIDLLKDMVLLYRYPVVRVVQLSTSKKVRISNEP